MFKLICKGGENVKIADVVPNLKNFVASVSHQLPENLDKIIVFGSYARGEARVSSDLDLALVSDGTGIVDKWAVADVLEDFDKYLKISFFCTNQTKIDTEQHKFNANYWIREEGKLLWEKQHTNISATET